MNRPLAFLDAELVCPEAGVRTGGLLIRDGAIVAVGAFEVPSGRPGAAREDRATGPAVTLHR